MKLFLEAMQAFEVVKAVDIFVDEADRALKGGIFLVCLDARECTQAKVE